MDLEEIESPEEAAPKRYALNPLREHSFDAVEEHLVELNDIIVSISKDLSRIEGRDEETPKIHNDMDFNSKRATNLRDPVDDQDAVTLNYLRRWLERYIEKDFEPGDRL